MNLYNGWIILDKPKGISSNDAVQKVRRFLGKENKVGHAGTLDPLAQGVLPIAVGEATKTVQYLMDAEKEYEFAITWGEERTTGDAEGEVAFSGGHIPTKEEIIKILPSFLGEIMQAPPIYSALKINGQPAYKLARKGLEVDLAKRKILIKSLDLLSHNEATGISEFRVECGKGTYVRSLAVDIARMLGSYGYVSLLKRTRVGNFLIKDTIMLANLINLVHNVEINLQLFPVNFGLGDILAIEITAEQAKALRNGLSIFLSDQSQISNPIVQILSEGILQAMACLEKGLCKPIRVFNLN
jgi:tRNA pseudouridine55 synthase